MTELRLMVLTPERALLSVEAALKVRLKLADGAWLSVYPGHAALIAEVPPGPVQYETAVESGELLVDGGVLHVQGDEVVVLTRGLLRRPESDGATVDRPVAANVRSAGDDESTGDGRFDRLARDLMHALGAHAQDSDGNPEAW